MELESETVPKFSLRERQKEATRLELRRSALQLFQSRGFAQTSVDDIAHAAGVSRSTFFRYYPSKEAVITGDTDESTELFINILRNRPPGESRMVALEETLVEFAQTIRPDDRKPELTVIRQIVDSDASLSAGRAASTNRWRQEVALALAQREGRAEPDLEDALASAVLGQITEQMSVEWQASDSTRPADELIRSYFATLRRLITT